MEYEAVIGLEVHVQIHTHSKMFTACPYQFGQAPNTLTDPVVMGLPGTLPTMNKEAVRQTIRAGMIFGCDIASIAKWDRKNYFYPDCPKNYQISQNTDPLCRHGHVEIELQGPSRNIMGEHKKIALDRIHLEEDVGKLTHFTQDSGVDYNRAGVPLMEIVSQPDMHTPDEAFAYLTSLRMHLSCAGISNCDMEKGEMRCDANVSVRPVGQSTLGTKVEIKNLNSISGVRDGIRYEIQRQIEELKNGGTIHQETRRWNADSGTTTVMRSKETALDYRYFADPDLMPVKITEETKAAIKSTLPEMPFERQERFYQQYQLPYTITSVLCPDKALSDYFESAVNVHHNPKGIANFIVNDLLRECAELDKSQAREPHDFRIPYQDLATLVKVIDEGVITKQIAQEVFIDMFHEKKSPMEIIEAKGLKQSIDQEALKAICQKAIDQCPKAVQEYRGGKTSAINAIKGFVMKETKGKANPAIVDPILHTLLD